MQSMRFTLSAGLMTLWLVACGGSGGSGGGAGGGAGNGPLAEPPASLARQPAECSNMVADAHVTRNELASGKRAEDAELLLRFVQLTDGHIIDDDGQAVLGLSALDPLEPTFESAMRLQEEYADEVLNRMIAGLNDCHADHPAAFALVTGDSADLATVAETRRFIDNLDGGFDRMGAFETACREDQPAASCARFTGRGLADAQTPDQDIDSLLTQALLTRTLIQLTATEAAALSGRAADGSVDPARETVTRSPGLPEVLRCTDDEPDCVNQRLAMPYLVAFGNHDGYVRGTVPLDGGANEVASLFGRRYMLDQRDYIDEFFFTAEQPGPVGHGFQHVEADRRADADPRNDGYYAFDAADGRFRMIVLNTIIDGADPRLPTDVVRNPFALADGGIDATQFAWLQAELAEAHEEEQLVVLFSHHPDLSFAEFGMFAALVPIEVTAAQLLSELARWPNLIAWVAGHTHRHRVRAFTVDHGLGGNGDIATAVDCVTPGACRGFWQIETASLIDHPQQQRLIEVFGNGDGTGTIRASILGHDFERSQELAAADDRCALYLSDPDAVAAAISEADLAVLCQQGGTRTGEAGDRNVELRFAMPDFGAS